MRKTQIISLVVLIFVAIPLAWALAVGFDGIFPYQGIYNKVKRDAKIAKEEKLVIEHMKKIREVQLAYYTNNKKYCATWDSLIHFMDSGVIYEIAKREIILPAEEVRPPEELYKGDSIRFEFDTLGSSPVVEKLFPADDKRNAGFDPSRIKYLPNRDGNKEFILKTDKVEKSGFIISTIEVINPYPVNPQRKETNENPRMRYLRFGSLSEVSVAGNWED